jgi:hypothetical protein
MRILFSDRARFAKLVAALLLLAGLGAYAAASDHWRCTSPGDCLAHPRRCDGRSLVAGPARITTVSPDGFMAGSGDGVCFSGAFPELAPGAYADVEAVFHAPDRFEAVAVHEHLERRVKIWGSLAAALVVAALIFRAWRRGGF